MANHYQRTVVTPPLPSASLTAADRLLLDMLFESGPSDDGTRFYFASEAMAFEADRDATTIRAAIDASPPGFAREFLEEALAEGRSTVPIDLAGSWERLLQDIVRRSGALDHIVVVTAFTCTKMVDGGFGGAATVVTADHIDSLSTFDFVETVLAERLSDSA